jgi:uncharacterized protein (TIGR02118 family)
MQISITQFNFKSGDIEAEEKNYFGNHVALARRMPGLRLYYTGRLMPVQGRTPDHERAAILGFDDAAAAAAAFNSEVIPPLLADTQAHLKDVAQRLLTAEVIVPFDTRRAEQRCLVMCAAFDLEQSSGPDAAERHYRDVHVGIARRLPGLRNYLIGKLDGGAERYRMAILVFDSLDALRDAYKSPAGQELVRDEEMSIRNPRVVRLDARVEV